MKKLETLEIKNSFFQLGADFFQVKSPDPVPSPHLINSNPDAIELIGLDLSEIQKAEFGILTVFSSCAPHEFQRILKLSDFNYKFT